ncbi:MAG: MaoC family dehydratase N-terminal domain-containing protein, partial [Ideonella sp.]|nr:MaoC family dehydratase N-terminal domain-containing protein [Ideonella sp.]
MQLTNRTLDELAPGDSAELRRLVTHDDLYVFAASSGNYNPLHLSDSDLDGDGASQRVAPGMFVASLISAVLGTQLPGAGTLYRRQVLDFHERAHAGEELLCRVQVREMLGDGMVRLSTTVRRVNDDALILSGEADVVPPQTKISLQQVEVPGLIVQRHRHFETLLERARRLPALPTAVVCPD